MSKKKEEELPEDDKDNVLFKKLRKLINLIDQLRDVGVQEYIKLPRIASLGTQSSGKSSVLESIVGLDFLPRGDGVVTRRPLELRLCHINAGEPYAYFEERKGVKFTDFNKVRETIELLTDEICVGEKNIVDKPIVLNVYSQTCPDLTLIDLPGVTRVPVGKQPKNIEEITKNMCRRYCDDPLTIILCVIAANSDIATSDGLKMAKELDTNGTRTLGVLTKLDIMDKGTDAKRALMNEEIPLKLGYVGVKNRSKQDLMDKIPMKDAFKKEKDFFSNHPVYRRMPAGYWGTDTLIQKLTKILFRVIREHLPTIIKAINDNLKKAEEELKALGTPMPVDDAGKMSMLWTLLNEFCAIYKNVLRGKFDSKRAVYLKDEGGYKIKALYRTLLKEFTGEYKATANYTDDDIDYALTIHEGDSIPGFPSVDAFLYLIRPELDKLKDPIEDCFNNVFNYLEGLAQKILEKSFVRFPQAVNDLNEFISRFLNEEKEKTKYIIDAIVEQETNYLFTNDYDYIKNYSTFIPKQEQPQMNQMNMNQNQNQMNQGKGPNQPGGMHQQQPPPMPKKDTKKLFIDEIRSRIEAYFKLIVRNLRDSVPKTIGKNLVNSIEYNMQLRLYNMLNESRDIISCLDEPESVMMRRKDLNEQIKVLKDAQKVIKKDPDLMQVMQININDSDITSHANEKKPEPANPSGSTHSSRSSFSQPQPQPQSQPHPQPQPHPQSQPQGQQPGKKGNFGNLFGK